MASMPSSVNSNTFTLHMQSCTNISCWATYGTQVETAECLGDNVATILFSAFCYCDKTADDCHLLSETRPPMNPFCPQWLAQNFLRPFRPFTNSLQQYVCVKHNYWS